MKLWIFVSFALFVGTTHGSRWSRTGSLNTPRSGQMTAILTNGEVMTIGGYLGGGDDSYEILDPATGVWTQYSSPIKGSHNMAMLLPNGNVLYLNDRWMFDPYYIYDPRTDSWDPSAASKWEEHKCATLLKDGRVLLMWDGENCKLYDYTNDTALSTGSTDAEYDHSVEVLLPSGEVLVCGRLMSGISELYNPGTGTWRTTGSMKQVRIGHVGVLLPPPWNKVLIAGGNGNRETELYDVNSGGWSYTGNLNHYPRWIEAMVLLPSGKALIVGGHSTESCRQTGWRECEIYDPDARTWTDTDNTQFGRGHFSAIILHTGKVLIAGDFWNSFRECEIYDPSDGKWAAKPSLNVERACHTVTLLPIIHIPNICSTNVLIAGGENSTGALKSCEVYNYSLDSVKLTDPLNEARSHHTAVLLASGEALVAGGKDGGTALASCELYKANPGTWTPTGNMGNARFDHTATLLKDGKVLVTGGESAGTYLTSCEIYNGSWTPTANAMATPRARHTAIILLNGYILVIGGQTTGGATASCELWNGTSWSPAGNLTTARYLHTATLLQSGDVLVIGGTSDGSTPLSSCEIYSGGSWSAEANLSTARYLHNTTLLYSGLVLVTGGNGGISSCETYDPATHKWTTAYTGALATERAYHSSVLIPDTMPFILAIGGKSGASYLNSIEEYDVGLGYRSIWQSTITNYPAVTLISDSMPIEGTLFRGVSEADGGNYCHIANSDHPIISLIRVGGGNWQGNGGGEILHMPLSSSWDTAHTVVHPEIADFQGYYRLWSIVNGIPCKWYEECLPHGAEEKTGIRHKAEGISVSVYPNPATTKAEIRFQVTGFRSQVTGEKLETCNMELATLRIYDLSGRLVRSLPITDNRTPITEVTWDGQDSKGKKVNSGIYFYSVKYKDSGAKGKFIILK